MCRSTKRVAPVDAHMWTTSSWTRIVFWPLKDFFLMSFLFCVFMWCGVRVSCAVVGVDIQLRGQPNCYFLSSTLFESGCLCYSLLSTLTSRSMSLWRFSCVFLWSFHRVVGLTNTKKVCQPFHVFWDSNSDPRA